LDELFWIYEPENKTYFQFYQNKWMSDRFFLKETWS
jgi:hypothetical protein